MPQSVLGDVSKDILRGVAITSCIFTLSVYLPIAGFFCAFFIPLPTLFYRSKLGRKTGGIVPLATVVLMTVIAGRISVDIVFFIEMLFLGFLLSELFEMNLSVEKTILYATGGVLATGFACLLVYSSISSTGIKALISNYVSQNLELTLALYKHMEMSEDHIRVISDSLEHIHYILVRIIPGLLIAVTLLISWTNLLIARPLLIAKNLFCPDFGMLKLWRPPEQLVWGVIGIGGLLLLPDRSVKMFGLNGLFVLMTIYFFGGIAIVSFFFDRKKLPQLFRVLLYTFIALQQFVLLFVIGLGLFDTWLNFRKIEPKGDRQ